MLVRQVSIRVYLLNHLDLAVEPGRPAFNQWYIGGQTHAIDMTPSIKIVQRIEDYVKPRKPVHVELAVLDIGVIRF